MVPRLQLPTSVQSTEPRQEPIEHGRPKSGSGRKACSARDGCLKEAEVSSTSPYAAPAVELRVCCAVTMKRPAACKLGVLLVQARQVSMQVAPCTSRWRFKQSETLPLWFKKAEHSSLLQADGAALQMEVWKCLQLKYLNASLRKTIVAAKPKVLHSSHGK